MVLRNVKRYGQLVYLIILYLIQFKILKISFIQVKIFPHFVIKYNRWISSFTCKLYLLLEKLYFYYFILNLPVLLIFEKLIPQYSIINTCQLNNTLTPAKRTVQETKLRSFIAANTFLTSLNNPNLTSISTTALHSLTTPPQSYYLNLILNSTRFITKFCIHYWN